MATKTIVSYDDTLNDQDALALGRILAAAGAELELVYVRHTTQNERSREQLDQDQAEALLDRGARVLGDLDVSRRVLVSGSTGEGLSQLAAKDDVEIIVFGSDYRTAAGHVQPGKSAQTLLEGGPAALAFAPANYRGNGATGVRTIGILASPGDEAATDTARELADALGATVTTHTHGVDLLVVGSRVEAPYGRVMITAQAGNAIENATAPVLIVPRGAPVRFATPVGATH